MLFVQRCKPDGGLVQRSSWPYDPYSHRISFAVRVLWAPSLVGARPVKVDVDPLTGPHIGGDVKGHAKRPCDARSDRGDLRCPHRHVRATGNIERDRVRLRPCEVGVASKPGIRQDHTPTRPHLVAGHLRKRQLATARIRVASTLGAIPTAPAASEYNTQSGNQHSTQTGHDQSVSKA